MNKMSKDEALYHDEKKVIDVLENVFIFKNTNDKFTKLDLECIHDLIHLYQQEKQESEKTVELPSTCNKRLEEISRILGLTEENQYGYVYNEIKQYIETLVDENNRLEDIEDKKVQIEYELVFNKGVQSVKDKIKEKICRLNSSDILEEQIAIPYLKELLEEE